MSTQASHVPKLSAIGTAITDDTVTEIGGVNRNRVMAILSNENLTAVTHDFYYAFGDDQTTAASFTQATMFRLRADSDLYFTDGVGTGPLYVYHNAGGPLTIKTFLG